MLNFNVSSMINKVKGIMMNGVDLSSKIATDIEVVKQAPNSQEVEDILTSYLQYTQQLLVQLAEKDKELALAKEKKSDLITQMALAHEAYAEELAIKDSLLDEKASELVLKEEEILKIKKENKSLKTKNTKLSNQLKAAASTETTSPKVEEATSEKAPVSEKTKEVAKETPVTEKTKEIVKEAVEAAADTTKTSSQGSAKGFDFINNVAVEPNDSGVPF